MKISLKNEIKLRQRRLYQLEIPKCTNTETKNVQKPGLKSNKWHFYISHLQNFFINHFADATPIFVEQPALWLHLKTISITHSAFHLTKHRLNSSVINDKQVSPRPIPIFANQMTINEQDQLHLRLEELMTEHRDLDDVIERLGEDGTYDQLKLQRLKKRKLILRDEMAKIESQLLPDIIA